MIYFLFLLVVMYLASKNQVDNAFALLSVLIMISVSSPETKSFINVWSTAGVSFYLVYQLYIQKNIHNRLWHLFLFFLPALWIIFSAFYNNTSIGSAIRTGLLSSSFMLWGYFSIHSIKSIEKWFLGVFLVLILNFMVIFDPVNFFSFIPRSTGEHYSGFVRSDGINYVHAIGILCGFFLITFLMLRIKKNRFSSHSGYYWRPFIISKNRNPIVVFFAYFLVILLLYKTFPRGSIVGIFISMFIYFAIAFDTKLNFFLRLLKIFLNAAILITIIYYLLNENLGRMLLYSIEEGVNRETEGGNRFEISLNAIAYLLNGHAWFGLGTESSLSKGVFQPHQIPVAYALYFGIPYGIFLLIIFSKGLINSIRYLILLTFKKNNGDLEMSYWWFSSIYIILVSVSFTNGAMILGYGFQWFLLGGVLSFNPKILSNSLMNNT